jgi:YgiT-type zinc finger domain-containing protein
MNCTIVGCPGTYEPRETVCIERVRGQLVVIEHVPVEVCDVCGDVLFRPETIRHLEALRHTETPPARTVPLYEYA